MVIFLFGKEPTSLQIVTVTVAGLSSFTCERHFIELAEIPTTKHFEPGIFTSSFQSPSCSALSSLLQAFQDALRAPPSFSPSRP